MANFTEKDNTPLQGESLQQHIEQALSVQPPENPSESPFYKLLKFMYRPVLSGTGNIPDRPCLWVGNHSLFALDGLVLGPLMLAELGIFLRPMGDRFLFASDSLAEVVMKSGTVMGHPEVCAAMMEAGQDLLVFPGGAHEAVKSAADMYSLQWKERYGFVRLAAWHGYTIMPFGMVGPDEFYAHWMEGEELLESRLGRLLRQVGVVTDNTRPDIIPPIPRGVLGTMLPKPQRCFIGFGQPIDLAELAGKNLSKARQKKIRAEVAGQIEQQLASQLLQREQRRREDGLLRRILNL